MLGILKKMFGVKPAETIAEVPYKVESPVVSPVEVVQTQVTIETTAKVESMSPAKTTPAKKPPAKKSTTTNKPRRTKSKA